MEGASLDDVDDDGDADDADDGDDDDDDAAIQLGCTRPELDSREAIAA